MASGAARLRFAERVRVEALHTAVCVSRRWRSVWVGIARLSTGTWHATVAAA
ncbi:MAG: hypothetical protein OXE79_04345 [Acidimicrobiaceae bacterium]|nr:hypothetical protein [Acidimicrobiaceae bacterium]MCY4279832.1 hypothetical protein [Acidimicrobiaceae bacterium]